MLFLIHWRDDIWYLGTKIKTKGNDEEYPVFITTTGDTIGRRAEHVVEIDPRLLFRP